MGTKCVICDEYTSSHYEFRYHITLDSLHQLVKLRERHESILITATQYLMAHCHVVLSDYFYWTVTARSLPDNASLHVELLQYTNITPAQTPFPDMIPIIFLLYSTGLFLNYTSCFPIFPYLFCLKEHLSHKNSHYPSRPTSKAQMLLSLRSLSCSSQTEME